MGFRTCVSVVNCNKMYSTLCMYIHIMCVWILLMCCTQLWFFNRRLFRWRQSLSTYYTDGFALLFPILCCAVVTRMIHSSKKQKSMASLAFIQHLFALNIKQLTWAKKFGLKTKINYHVVAVTYTQTTNIIIIWLIIYRNRTLTPFQSHCCLH